VKINKFEQILANDIVKHVFDTLEEGILIVDSECRIVFYNRTLSRLEGLKTQDVVGKLLYDVFPSITPEESTLCKVMKTGESIREWLQEYFNYQGKEIKTVNTTIPLWDGSTIIGALEVSHDVSLVVCLTEKISFLQQSVGKDKMTNTNKVPFSFADIIGSSSKISSIIDLLKKVSLTTSTVLIYGETGTGKELFAQSLHNEGKRRNKPFIAQNCAALPESLLESIMFGSTKGSFTGAADKAGLFEQAKGGTVLLDEINSMSLSLQAKLLRVLQERTVRRLGGTEDVFIDVRVIATTNEKPADLVKSGRLREDLYYRLSVISVEIPPLCERREDICELTNYFITKYNFRFRKKVTGLEPDVMLILQEYSWPGNVRELEHLVEALLNFSDSGLITIEQLKYLNFGAFKNFMRERSVRTSFIPNANYFKMNFFENEKNSIVEAMKTSNGNITHAANLLGMKRQSLQYRLKKYHMTTIKAK
jgi:arginine utilization regulatory protein